MKNFIYKIDKFLKKDTPFENEEYDNVIFLIRLSVMIMYFIGFVCVGIYICN